MSPYLTDGTAEPMESREERDAGIVGGQGRTEADVEGDGWGWAVALVGIAVVVAWAVRAGGGS